MNKEKIKARIEELERWLVGARFDVPQYSDRLTSFYKKEIERLQEYLEYSL